MNKIIRKVIPKAKGVVAKKLTYEKYEQLLNLKTTTAFKNYSIKDYEQGSVEIITDAEVILRLEEFNKRIKIYNNLTWVDTKPFTINTIEKQIVLYNKTNKQLVLYKKDIKYHPQPIQKVEVLSKKSEPINYLYLAFTFIILSILFILAKVFDENDMEEFHRDEEDNFPIEVIPSYKENYTQSKNCIFYINEEYNENNQELFDQNPHVNLVEENFNYEGLERLFDEDHHREVDLFNTLQTNLENHYVNSVLTFNTESECKIITTELENKLNMLLSSIETYIENDDKSTTSSFSDQSLTESDKEFEQLVREIRSGSTVTILSPVSCNESDVSLTEIAKHPFNDVNSELGKPSDVGSSELVEKKLTVLKKPVIIIKKVNEGDPIPVLPSWMNISHTHKDYKISERWVNWILHKDFTNNHVDNSKPSTRNQDWMEENDTLDLETLFNEGDKDNTHLSQDNSDSKHSTPNQEWME